MVSYSPALVPKDTSTALNFDAVCILADFPLAYKHSNLNLDIATWCKPAQNLQLKLLSWSETGNKPICMHQIKAQTQQQTFCIKQRCKHNIEFWQRACIFPTELYTLMFSFQKTQFGMQLLFMNIWHHGMTMNWFLKLCFCFCHGDSGNKPGR